MMLYLSELDGKWWRNLILSHLSRIISITSSSSHRNQSLNTPSFSMLCTNHRHKGCHSQQLRRSAPLVSIAYYVVRATYCVNVKVLACKRILLIFYLPYLLMQALSYVWRDTSPVWKCIRQQESLLSSRYGHRCVEWYKLVLVTMMMMKHDDVTVLHQPVGCLPSLLPTTHTVPCWLHKSRPIPISGRSRHGPQKNDAYMALTNFPLSKEDIARKLNMTPAAIESYGQGSLVKLHNRDWARLTTLELVLIQNAFQSSDADPNDQEVKKGWWW